MFGISASEFLVILCVALVFIRPKDLPRLVRSLGRAYARLRATIDSLRAEKDGFLAEMDREAGGGAGEAQEVPLDKAFEPYRKPADAPGEGDGGPVGEGAGPRQEGS